MVYQRHVDIEVGRAVSERRAAGDRRTPLIAAQVTRPEPHHQHDDDQRSRHPCELESPSHDENRSRTSLARRSFAPMSMRHPSRHSTQNKVESVEALAEPRWINGHHRETPPPMSHPMPALGRVVGSVGQPRQRPYEDCPAAERTVIPPTRPLHRPWYFRAGRSLDERPSASSRSGRRRRAVSAPTWAAAAELGVERPPLCPPAGQGYTESASLRSCRSRPTAGDQCAVPSLDSRIVAGRRPLAFARSEGFEPPTF